jgi:8-oxo-dGTP diphosphatase
MHGQFRTGINIFVIKDGQLLLGKRKNVYGAGTWGLPGGHLEFGEAMEDAARRELMEETGLYAQKFRFINIVNDRSKGRHYIEIGFIAEGIKGEPVVKEPDKTEEWKWFNLDNLPQNLFPPQRKLIELFLKNLQFSDNS